jgi:hypothetical protein
MHSDFFQGQMDIGLTLPIEQQALKRVPIVGIPTFALT